MLLNFALVESQINGLRDTQEHEEQGQNNIIDERFEQVKVGFHNINGLKGNDTKLQELIDFGIEENLG